MVDEIDNQYYQKYENLLELAAVLGRQNDYDEILRIITVKVLSLFNADVASIVMINPRTDKTIKTIIKSGNANEQYRHHFVQTNVIGWANKNNQSLISSDLKNDSRFSKNIFRDSSVNSVMCISLMSESIVIGYILVMNESENKNFNQNNLSLFEKFGAIAAPFLSNLQKISEYFESPLPEAALTAKYESLGLLGKSKSFKELLKAIEAAARCDVRVLLEGQSGTGKELIAKAIHQLSARKNQNFVAVDCGAIPDQLIESEFFGHVKGAFTGASQDRKGLFEEAHKGTLFMDEISNLPIEMQSKLLRILQEGEVRIIGSNQVVKVDVRVIAASSPPLIDLVEQKKFREDLYYRLHVYPINIPTLNKRQEDILILANNFLRKFMKEQNKNIESFHPSIGKYLQKKEWIGNIRELENFVERLVTLTPINRKVIDSKIIPKEYLKEFKKLIADDSVKIASKPLQESINSYEKEVIHQALIRHKWNQSKAARSLRISERAIRYRMEKLGIKKPRA